MNPSPFAYRLPTEAEADRILQGAVGKGSQTPEGKAKNNLLKSLDWAYNGLDPASKGKVEPAYQGRLTPLGQALANQATIRDVDVLAMVRCMVGKKPVLQHPGQAIQPLTGPQETAITQVLEWFKLTNTNIESGLHNAHVDSVFPKLETSDPDLPERVKEVVQRLKRAEECVRKLFNEKKIVIAEYHAFVQSGGGGGPTTVDLKAEFFASYSEKQRQATLAHEATHTMPLPWHTDDHCYIHQPLFQTLPLATRYKNASHFEALIRLINGETLNLAAGVGGANGAGGGAGTTPASLAISILSFAWTQAWRWYGDLARQHQTDLTKIDVRRGPSLDLIDQAHVLGLPWAKVDKGFVSTEVMIRDSDLAFMENRVAKLGVMMGSSVVNNAAQSIGVTDPNDLTFTQEELNDHKLRVAKVEKVITKVIEFEGALRKSTNNKKTLDMIMALAEKKIETEKNDTIRPLVTGRYKYFIATYPIKKGS